MDFGFGRLVPKKQSGIVLAARVGKQEVDFLLFREAASGIEPLSWGTEQVSHFTVRQALEKIFENLPQKEHIRQVVTTFDASSFRARVVKQSLAPSASSHIMDRVEALALERDAKERAAKEIQKNVFAESGIVPSEFTMRRVKIVERRINGYLVPRLEGYKKGAIQLSILGVFLLEKAFVPLESFIHAHGMRDIRVVHIAEALELFTRMRKKEGIYLSVEEEKTQIGIRKKEHFVFPSAISMGAESFTEFFGDTLGMSETSAELFQRRYFQEDLSQATMEKMAAMLLPEVRKFDMLVKEKLLEAKIMLPEHIWLFGKSRAIADPNTLLEHAVFSELPFSQDPQSDFLLPKDVWNMKNVPFANDPFYTQLCLLGAFSVQNEFLTG